MAVGGVLAKADIAGEEELGELGREKLERLNDGGFGVVGGRTALVLRSDT